MPNIEGGYEILLAVRGREVGRLQAAIEGSAKSYEILEEIPNGFWARLGILVAQRNFRLLMVKDLYLAMMQRQALLQKLDAAVEPLYPAVSGSTLTICYMARIMLQSVLTL